ncbi:candidate lipase [Postia placenta Mad-698-R]|nr:candidate lipase [Postia placenta Mad-698-R]
MRHASSDFVHANLFIGLYGFDVRGPSAFPILQQHYWSNVLSILRDRVGAEVIVTAVPRYVGMDRILSRKAPGRGINFMAHSMGGLDCRHLITHIKPAEYTPLSLTTIATPHRGSPFMDWCRENIGIGRLRQKELAALAAEASSEKDAPNAVPLKASQDAREKTPTPKSTLSLASLPSSFTTLLLSLLDSPAYANLTSTYLNTIFNPNTPDHPSVKYFSIAGRIANLNIWHPLWLPKMVLDGYEERERERSRSEGDSRWAQQEEWGNDALVTIQSARWGQFLGVLEGCDHWDMRGARGIEVDLPSVSVPGLNILGGSKAKDDKQKEAGDGWNLTDWGRFVRAWKREEKAAAKSAGAGVSEQKNQEAKARELLGAQTGAEKEQADEVLKSSTDKLSAVFDWIVEQVPSPRALGTSSNASEREHKRRPPEPKASRERNEKQAEKSDLATKMDLERFYVALCRKLYDEGL